jgi:coatomer subunit beta'
LKLIVIALLTKSFFNRGIYPPAEEYTIHAERSNESLVEAFKNMHVHEEEDAHEEDVHDEEELTNENDTVHEVLLLRN